MSDETVSYDGMPPDAYDEEGSDDEMLYYARPALIAQVEREDAAARRIHLVEPAPEDQRVDLPFPASVFA